MKKALALSLVSLVLCFSFAACGESGTKQPASSGMTANTADPTGAPDYSSSTKKLNMYAFLGPTDGSSATTTNGTKIKTQDFRTKERYQEYKDCGFDVLLLLGNNTGSYSGAGYWADVTEENMDELKAQELAAYNKTGADGYDKGLKMNLDLCAEVGLQTIVFDHRVHLMTTVETSLIKEEGKAAQPIVINCANGSNYVAPFDESKRITWYAAEDLQYNDSGTVKSYGKLEIFDANGNRTTETEIKNYRMQFEDEADLVRTLEVWTSPYINHTAFYGMSMFDEPANEKLKAVGQVDRALSKLDPDMFVQTCLLPYYGGSSSILSVSNAEEFKKYINLYLDETGSEYFGYDYYPMTMDGDATSMQSTYLYCLQMSAELARENDCDWEIIVQTYAQSNYLREVGYADVDLQVNLALAFGAYNVGYFTYWMWENKTGWSNYCAIMDDYGNKVLYDEVQKVNSEAKELAKIILNYDYEKTQLRYADISAPVWYRNVTESELDGVKSYESTGNTLVNQMYDKEKQCRGYMVVNVGDPATQEASRTMLEFDGYENVMIVRNGKTSYKKLDQGKITAYLAEGESVFLIPYNS